MTTPITIGGSHRGGTASLPGTLALHHTSERLHLAPTFVDIEPGRAEGLARTATAAHMPSQAIEARVQDVIHEYPEHPVKLHLDHPREVATSIAETIAGGAPLLAFQLWRVPYGPLLGVAVTIPGHDTATKRLVEELFDRVATVTGHGTSEDVIGTRARPEHILLEPALRSWFIRHEQEHLARFLNRTSLAASPVTVTFDGDNDLPVVIAQSTSWQDPITLAHQVIDEPRQPLPVARPFVIGEVGPDGLRLHRVRRRQDGRLALYNVLGIDPWSVAAERERQLAIERAARQSITRRAPLLATD